MTTATDLPIVYAERLGAGRGAREGLPFDKKFHDATTRFHLRLVYTDKQPGAAAAMAARARDAGISAAAREADVRDLRPDEVAPLLIMQLDDARAHADAARRFTASSILAHQFIRTNDDRLLAVHANIAREDTESRDAAALFFDAVADNVAPGGSQFIFGDEGRDAHRKAEPLYRRLIGLDIGKNLEKAFIGSAPETPGLWMSVDGRKAVPMVVLDHRARGLQDPALIAHEVLGGAHLPIRTGNDLLAAEIGPDSELRLHTMRRRRIDGRVALDGAEVLDPRAVTPRDAERWKRITAQRTHLLARAASAAVTRHLPVYVSD